MTKSMVIGVAAVVGSAMVAYGDPKSDLETELRTIATNLAAPPPAPVAPYARKDCTAPTQAERADITKRVLAWIDAKHPDERGPTSAGPDDMGLVTNFGCKETSGAVVLDLSQDRDLENAKQGALGTRRNYVLRVSPTAIDVIAEDTSTASLNWMEWADEGRIALLGQVDVDGDGALDVVYSDHEHEGGAIRTYDRIHVRFANGTLGESGKVTDLSDVRLVGNQLVVAGRTRAGAAFYACLDRKLHLGPCAASVPFQRAADRLAIIDRYTQLDPSDLPDRELLDQELTALGIKPKRRAAVVALAPATSATVRAQRDVTAFLVKANLVDPTPMPDLITQPHPEARTYLDDLATKLGDTTCTTTALTADERARATAWVRKQDAKAVSIEIAASACGPYTWIAWSPSDDSKRREVLLGRDGTTRILGFTYDPEMMPEQTLGHTETWFTHDGTIVGIAIAAQNLWVIANGKAVAQTKGDSLAPYRADDRSDETSNDVFVDGGTLWRATPNGRERLDLTLVRDHEAQRAAIALLSQTPPSSDAKYIAALQLLGADKALIAECKKL